MTTALWPTRWPAIAKQECIDEIEAAPVEKKAEVKWALPCDQCELAASCLNAKRKELGPLLYDREILTQPRTSESSLFPEVLFTPLLNRQEAQVPYWHKPFGVEYRYGVAQAWDIAWSERIGGDYLVCMTGVIDRQNGQKRLLEIQRWRGKTFDEQVRLIEQKWLAFKSDVVIIEAAASQVVWRQHMARNTQVPVRDHGVSDKRDFKTGVPGLLIALQNRKWVFPYERGSHHFEEMQNFLNECEAFGMVDGKLEGVGEHDDTVMAWWHLDYGLTLLAASDGSVQEMRRGVQSGAYI